MATILYFFIALALTLVGAAGVYGGMLAHKASNGAGSNSDLAIGAARVTGMVVVACALAFATSYMATLLSQFG